MKERYEIKAKIGQGGLGAVYRAFDSQLKRDVAIKRLLPEDEREAEQDNAQLVSEAATLSQLQHPNVVTVYDAGIDDDGAFIVMELIKGENIDVTVKRSVLALEDFHSVATQSLEALQAAHGANILHRDVKPSNVMLRWLPNGRPEVKVLDFGLAKITQKPALQTIAHGNSVLGSVFFMAPEQFERQPLDPRTDLYSLGCLLYFTLAGEFPYKGDTPAQVMTGHLEGGCAAVGELRSDIPKGISDWIAWTMNPNPNDRPDSATEALDCLRDVYEALPKLTSGEVATASAMAEATRPKLITGVAPGITTAQTPLGSTTLYHTTYTPPNTSRATLVAILTSVIVVGAGGWWAWSTNAKDSQDNPIPGRRGQPEPSNEGAAASALPTNTNSTSTPPVEVVAKRSTWSYLSDGSAADDGWKRLEFDDSQWSVGAGPLGYGDPGLGTELGFGPDPDDKHLVCWFRHPFEVAELRAGQALQIGLQVDDGARVYINGKRVINYNLPEGTLSLETRANRAISNERETRYKEFVVKTDVLRAGSNIVTARVHQEKKTSSDLRFDLEMHLVHAKEPAP